MPGGLQRVARAQAKGLGPLLQSYRRRAGLGCAELARAAGLDPSYLSRLERGERTACRLATVEALIRALQLALGEADGLRVSAGYTPVLVAQLGDWPPALQAVVAVLADETRPTEARERFGAFVQQAVQDWLQQEPADAAAAVPSPRGS
jgi:transcriptional regulator with XRE-family HTH domain